MHKPSKIIIAMALLASSGMAQAVIIDSSTVIPDSNILINFNGLDWVYAGPIAPNEFGPGNIQAPSYRASEGWRFATANEWATRPDWTDFIQPGYTTADVPAAAGWNDHTKYKFASEYWGDFYHVDLNDAAEGRITNGYDIGSLSGVYETWYVRPSAVPVPAAAWLLGSGLLGLIGVARRKTT